MRGTVTLPAILALLVVPAQLSAKGSTTKITIRGGDLAAPIEITDPKIVKSFNVWTGPGTSSNQAQGLIADWSRDVARPPQNLPVYEVLFFTTRSGHRAYVVSYLIDPSTNDGYLYLPGKTDVAYRDNVWMIYRGVEGKLVSRVERMGKARAPADREGTKDALVRCPRRLQFTGFRAPRSHQHAASGVVHGMEVTGRWPGLRATNRTLPTC